ncbi:MAG: Chaperone SurA [Legionellaceae bacterium]
MKLKIIIPIITGIFLIQPTLAAKKNDAIALDKIVAIVNENIITQQQLNNELHKIQHQLHINKSLQPNAHLLRKQVLNHLIDETLILQIAKQMKISIDENKADKAIDTIAARNGISREKLRLELKKQGVNFETYRQDIAQQMLISEVQQKAVAGQITISDTEINELKKQLEKKPIKQSHANAEYQLQDILLSFSSSPTTEEILQQKKKAKDLLTKIRKGEDFQRLATEESQGQEALQGGDLGWRKLNEFPELFKQQIPTMKIGDTVGPLRAPNGFHLIRLAGIRNQEKTPIQEQITETKVQQIFIKKDVLSDDKANKLRLINIREAILHGKSFAQLATENSQDPNSAHAGGLRGWLKPGMVDSTFEEVMNKLQPGEISQPFSTEYGCHIIQVLERRKVNNQKNFYHEQAQQILFQRKAQEALQTWLQELRQQAYIKIIKDNE